MNDGQRASHNAVFPCTAKTTGRQVSMEMKNKENHKRMLNTEGKVKIMRRYGRGGAGKDEEEEEAPESSRGVSVK